MKSVYISLVAFAISLLLTVFVTGGIDCGSYIERCTCYWCCTTGTCSSGPWSGTVCGCGSGDPAIPNAPNKCTLGIVGPWKVPNGNARDYLQQLGYCQSWYGSSYSNYDFTKRVDGATGRCRFQAIITYDNTAISLRDGPEPNPQPAYFCNGNVDLVSPVGCVVDTISKWHNTC